MTEPFGARLARSVAARGPLCAGIDPHPELLKAWGLPGDAAGLERFARTAVEAIAPQVAVVKPQSAFFEAHGPAGSEILRRVIDDARAAGALVLLDNKRGDIGSTMAAYSSAYLAEAAPFTADAVTVSPYLGFGSLQPAIAAAESAGKGVFVLARTSNPEAAALQAARLADGRTVAQSIVDEAAARNAGGEPGGSVGVVVGATIEPGELDLDALNGPILAPGLGAQGATAGDLRRVFGANVGRVLPAASREILRYGPEPGALVAATRSLHDQLAAVPGHGAR